MLSFLINQALKKVWCSPFQDRHAILALAKMTGIGGVRESLKVQWDDVPLPTPGVNYAVYTIGQSSPERLNLAADTNVWYKLSELCGARNMIIDLYSVKGIQFSRYDSYIRRTSNRTYIVAIRYSSKLPDLDITNIYMRLYSNAFYSTPRYDPTNRVHASGITVVDPTSITALKNELAIYRAKSEGACYVFQNGKKVNDLYLTDIVTGDKLEFVYDPSIDRIVEIPLDDLETFTSEMDSCLKYLVHPPKVLSEIAYHDDVDFWLIRKDVAGVKHTGYFFHKNSPKAVRMVTHQDYSIPTSTVDAYLTDNPTWSDTSRIYLVLHIRESGYKRPLVSEHSRLLELYKLDDAEIVNVLLGVNANIPEWQVATLEQSDFCKIMRFPISQISSATVVDMFGYHSAAKLIADTPVITTGDTTSLPVGHWYNSTIFEYDADGLLLGFYLHNDGETYIRRNSEAALLEGVSGIGDKSSGIITGTPNLTMNPLNSYRFYVSDLDGLVWEDVTDNTDYYTVTAGVVTWLIDTDIQQGWVKVNDHFLCYELTLPLTDNVFDFDIQFTESGLILPIPPGKIDIWANGKALIEEVDYYLDFPTVVITNKEYLMTTLQVFTIRGVGFANTDLTLSQRTQKGFVNNGKLSVDNIYNLRDDRVIRCIVDGKTYHRSVLDFSEDTAYLGIANIANGRPYLIEDVIVPIRGLSDYDTFYHRVLSLEVDQRVSDYLNLRLPDVIPPINTIPNKYDVYSPFTAKLIYELQQDNLSVLPVTASNAEIADALSNYLYLLDFDPCRKVIDTRYISIHPHQQYTTMEVTQAQYAFLERIISLYLSNKVDLSLFVTISAE